MNEFIYLYEILSKVISFFDFIFKNGIVCIKYSNYFNFFTLRDIFKACFLDSILQCSVESVKKLKRFKTFGFNFVDIHSCLEDSIEVVYLQFKRVT
jgi:hypothetical protein